MKTAKNYDDIDWQQCRKELLRLQFEVLKAYRTNDKEEKFNKIQQAQHSLTRSFAARCLAVRKVYCYYIMSATNRLHIQKIKILKRYG